MLPQPDRNRKLERWKTGCQHIRSRTEEQAGNSLRHTRRRFHPLRLAPTDRYQEQGRVGILLFVGPIFRGRRFPSNLGAANPSRTASPGSDAEIRPAVYINRRYADILIPAGENPVGQPVSQYDKSFRDILPSDPKQTCTICGIVSDLYINTLEEEAMPSLIYLNNAGDQHYRTLYVRLNDKQKKEGMETLQAVWKKVNPSEYFTYMDVYEVFMQRNRRTTDMANLLLMYSIISIFLTCFGLFGMAVYATEQRTKEIGIRKVNGASTRSIMFLLIRQFVKWIAVAFVIATPLTWLLLNRWLESFANRVSISPLYFLMGGGIVLAITLLTVGWHSYRAASSNPVKSLRSE